MKDNAIIYRMFIWVTPEDYFRTMEPAIENIKLAWDKYGIQPPMAAPQAWMQLEGEQ